MEESVENQNKYLMRLINTLLQFSCFKKRKTNKQIKVKDAFLEPQSEPQTPIWNEVIMSEETDKSLIVTKVWGEILLHSPNISTMFNTIEPNLVGMNFFDLMSSYDKKFFRTNTMWDHYLFEQENKNVIVKSSECNSRTIRYSTPHADNVQLSEINVLTSKLVSLIPQILV